MGGKNFSSFDSLILHIGKQHTVESKQNSTQNMDVWEQFCALSFVSVLLVTSHYATFPLLSSWSL